MIMRPEPTNCILLTAVISLLIPFAVHLLLVRVFGLFRKTELRQKGVFFSVLAGILPLAALCIVWVVSAAPSDTVGLIVSLLYFFLIYLLAGYVYFHFFNMSETARRVRLLIESSKTGSLNKTDLKNLYPHQDIVSVRIERLSALGELRRSGDRYVLGNRVLLLPAKLIFTLRRLLFPRADS